MPSKCKICSNRVQAKDHRQDGLCLVCSGVKKRCQRCKKFFDATLDGDYCPRCISKNEQKAQAKQRGTRVRYPSQSTESQRARMFREAFKKFGLDQLKKGE